MNSLYWFSSQKHCVPPQHLGNLAMRAIKPREQHHASIPAPENLQKHPRDAPALRQGELSGILRNLLATRQPCHQPSWQMWWAQTLMFLSHPATTAQKSPPATESCSTSPLPPAADELSSVHEPPAFSSLLTAGPRSACTTKPPCPVAPASHLGQGAEQSRPLAPGQPGWAARGMAGRLQHGQQ